MAHAYNPSYSGGRGQEDHGSKPALGKLSGRPVLKIPKQTNKQNKKPGLWSGSSGRVHLATPMSSVQTLKPPENKIRKFESCFLAGSWV
jgi:hypothetical protein